MTPLEHLHVAERLLEEVAGYEDDAADNPRGMDDLTAAWCARQTATAHVHALLATIPQTRKAIA